MDYICLAAGKGTRFGNLGRYLQKCMYPVGLTPFLELTIQHLLKSSLTHPENDSLTLVVGHHKEQLQTYFGHEYDGLKLRYVTQEEQLGTGHALHLVYKEMQPTEPMLCWLADMYVPTSLFQKVQGHHERNVQTVAPGHEDEKEDLKVTTNGDLVSQAWKGSEALYDIGLWKLSPEVLNLMMTERHGEYRMVPNLQYAIDQGHRLGYVKVDEWLHLGGVHPTPEINVLAVVKRLLELRR